MPPHSRFDPFRILSPPTRTVAVERVLTAVSLISFAVAAWDLATGGFNFRVLGIRVSSWEVYKPLRNGSLCAVVAVYLHDRAAPTHATTWQKLQRAGPGLMAVFVVAWTLVAIRCSSRAVGGSDTYGYVTEAALWASGHLIVRDRLAELAPVLGPSVAPLGYQLATVPGAIVPTYPPGLPLVMALAMRTTRSAESAYYVVPLAGGIAIWLTYLLGARLAGSLAGLLAAVATGLSPTVIFQSLHPMSDVPATLWWLLAWTLAWSRGKRMPFAAGLAVSMAVLTRPNLVPLAAIIAVVVVLEQPRAFRAAAFSSAVVPSCVVILLLNDYLYGSPARNGYGRFSDLYTWANAGANVRNYIDWFVDLHSPAAFIGLAAPFVVRSKHAWLMLAFVAAVLGSYLFYFVYDGWIYLRFLLPAIPLLFVLAGATTLWLIERLPTPLKSAAFVLVVLLAGWCEVRGQHFDVFDQRRSEQRFAIVGGFLGRTLPPQAVVLSLDESGSVRLYGHRQTVRWDIVAADRLDRTLQILREHEFTPYILLEPWEEALFRARFAQTSVFGRLDWPPAIQVRGPIAARVYAVDDRMRFLDGETIRPIVLPVP